MPGFELHIYNSAETPPVDFCFPWTPAKLGPTRASTMLPFKILDFGDFQFQRGIGPHQLQIAGRLPGKVNRSRWHGDPNGSNAFRDPIWIITCLENSQQTRTPLLVYVPQIPIFKYTMMIASIGWSIPADGGWAGDIQLDSLQLVEISDRYLVARPADLTSSWPVPSVPDVVDVIAATGGDGTDPIEGDSSGTRPDDGVPATYTVQSGDSLWLIAQTLWGDGARWTELYAANKDAVDSANAGVGPDLIYPGLELSIPGGAAPIGGADQVLVDIGWTQPLGN